jgi:serine/threonine protein phosphatase PrpC
MPSQSSRLHFDVAVRSHVGAVRTLNEDVILYATGGGEQSPRGILALVADGMGGHAAGEVASRIAAETVRCIYFEQAGAVPAVFGMAFDAANRQIQQWAADHPECAGMGTTCTAVALQDTMAWIAHIGDSRAYLMRAGRLSQLTADQTLVARLVREGKLREEEAAQSPVNNVLLQALGMGPDVAPAISTDPLTLMPGDTLLLCSDGLSGLVSDRVIADTVVRLSPHDACDALIDAALAAGGHDNISVGILRAETDVTPSRGPSSETRELKVPKLAVGD